MPQLLTALAAQTAAADLGFYESEPNDRPGQFHEIAGAITLYGTMVGQDQDGYLWTVSDDDARQRWTFTLNGEPGALTIAEIVRLERADNGIDVVAKDTLFKMGTRDGVTPSIHEDLLFEPGEYLIGLAQAGAGRAQQDGPLFRPPLGSLSFGETSDVAPDADPAAGAQAPPPNAEPGAYRFTISEGSKIATRPPPPGRDSRETAHALRQRGSLATFDTAEAAWYKLSFDDDAGRYDLTVQAPVGRALRARLLDGDGKALLQGRVDDKGQLRFPDLAPAAGTTWYVHLTTEMPGFIHVLTSEAVGERIAGEEREPNTNYHFANRIDFAQPVTGRIGGDDAADHFRYWADASDADELKTLRLEAEPAVRMQLCLKTPKQEAIQCRSGDAPLELPDLALREGEWAISIDRAAAPASYRLALVRQGPVEAGVETEPNDRIEFANGMPDRLRIKGRFSGDDTDIYEFLVSDTPQLWRFQVIGDEIFEVGYYDGSRQQKDKIRAAPGQRRVRLENVFLLPGRHFIRVSGRDGGRYTLLARALGPPSPDAEIEPNDTHNKQRLAIGQTRVGLASDENDLDYYRFFVANWDHLRLTLTPPADGLIAPNVYWYDNVIGQGQPDAPGEPMVLQGVFPPGDYHVVLNPRQASEAEYTLQLERLPRFGCPADCEPNGQGLIWLAAPLPPDLVLEGAAGQWRDEDVYALPAFDRPAEMFIASAEPLRLGLGTSYRDRQWLQHDAEAGGFVATVPAGAAHRLMIESRGKPYRLALSFPNGELTPVTEPLPATVALSLEQRAVSAFRQHGQTVTGMLRIANAGAEPLEVELEAVTSDHRWTVALADTTASVPAVAGVDVPVTVHVPSDAWADRPVRISVRARDATQRATQAWQTVEVERDLPPVNPVLHWDIPEAVRGGLNAAWLPFGARWTADSPNWATRADYLRDGLVFDGVRLASGADGDGWQSGEHHELTLDLPGDEPLPVAGTAIHHYGTPGPFFDVREGTLLLSLDGERFDEALRFEALPVETEQSFALARPIPARFARLRIDSTFREPSAERAAMAEWKVLLQPGHDLSAGEGFNIADPAVGGHLVWDWPPEPYAPRNVLTPDDASKAAGMQRGLSKEYVIGFHQNRAAQITRIDWRYADDARADWKNFARVEASSSLDSPIGPWVALGELSIDPDDANGSLSLAEPTWARFVRLVAHRPSTSHPALAPGQILVRERPTGQDYLSVLGEWGTLGPRAHYEAAQGLKPEAALVAADHTTRARAAQMRAGEPVQGYVALGRQSHWYRMQVPAGDNTLAIVLRGDPTVRTVVTLETMAGDEIALRRLAQASTPGAHAFEAVVDAGSEVYLHVEEPPRNVAFAWDTSASVNAYIPLINNAIVAFSGQVVSGQETVNLFPFPTGPLLRDWLGEPYMLQTILNDYRRPSASSAAEVTLKLAARELAPLPGTKAIVVVTDGDVTHHGQMWHEFQRAQPRVFALQVAGAERLHQTLLRDWSTVNGGHFAQLVYDGEMEVAFDRATTLMHRPAGYTLSVDSEFREAPGPGRLKLVAGEDTQIGGAAVELILDASGSMLQRLGGKRRIAIAKEVLIGAVREHIPAGTPLALRVFGHKEVDSCRTDLEIPLRPLEPGAAAERIDSINAMNLARTPIAASLEASAGDLEGHSDGAIILVTDGEETCDGDPGAAIDALRAKGLDVTINIVGFAIDDDELEGQFAAWAEAGGGRYFGADDRDGLSDAIERALRVPFVVYDRTGTEVATGQVGGDPVELEQGIYSVLVRSRPPRRLDAVTVQGEAEVIVEAGSGQEVAR